MTRPLVTLERLSSHPRRAWITCTQPFGHDGPHKNIDRPNAGPWEDEVTA